MFFLIVGLAVALGLAGYMVMLYNGLVRSNNLVDEGWSGIEVQLKRRYDLIPNLVETVKGYDTHEKDTFEKIVALRNTAMSSDTATGKAEIENQITGALKSIFALAEAYPELKANENFKQLQQDLSKIEDEIQNARRYYNATVRELNTKTQVFPTSIFAGVLGFSTREYFEAKEGEKENVKVDFDQ